MTVETTTKKVTATGNGSATTFSFSPIVIYAATDLVVVTTVIATGVETTRTQGTGSTNWSIGLTTYPATGSITYPADTVTPLPATETITIKRVLPLEQSTDLENQGGYFPDVQEQQFDKLVMIDLQQQEEIDRSFKAPLAETSIGTIPQLADRKGYLMGFNVSTGDPEVSSQTTATIEAGSTAAAASAAAALVSENAAAASASAASTSETNAATSETNASNSADSAAASAAGIYWKAPCEVSSTANLTLSGEQTIDGILTSGSRIVVRHQTAAAENGIYITAAGAWARAAPMDTWDEHVGAVVLVNQGTAYANTAYQCTVTPGGTLDTTDITWSNFGAVAINQSVDNWTDTTDYTSGTTTALTLTIDPGSENNCAVSFDGVMQHHNTYSVSGTTLTFDAAIPLGTANIEARYASSVGVGTPSDGTVTTAKIADDAVTLAKLAAGTDGELITWDAAGDPAVVAVGTVGQVLTSGGAGVAPTMQTISSGPTQGTLVATTSGTAVTFSGIPAGT